MEEEKSKSQKKREAHALQAMGMELLELKESDLEDFALSPELFVAIREAKKLKSHGAMRRHAQLIGKLMRRADSDLIAQKLQAHKDKHQAITADFHEAELWRDKLIENPQALTEFVNQYTPKDLTHFRQILKKAKDERSKQVNHGAYKTLFRLIRDAIL